MRYRVEETPMATFSVTDGSLRSRIQRNNSEDSLPENESLNKNIGVHKYMKMFRPLYVRASKIRIFDQLSPRKQGSRASVFREVCGKLVKSRSAVGIVPVPASARRRDDSALQQQDGIQSAILHCKRSYSSSSSSSSTILQEYSMLSRSASDSSYQKALNPLRNSTDEEEK